MNGIVVDIQPKPIRSVFAPLSSQFGITVAGGGSTTQFYYTNGNLYIPNRKVAPMMLKPSLYIVDPEGIIGNGNKTSSLKVSWFENMLSNPIATGTDYTVNADGTLLVKKNIPVSTPIQIICQASFTDIRNGKPIVFEDRVALNSIAKSDERVSMSIDKDIVIPYNPISDNNIVEIKATLYLGSNEAPAANAAYFWYRVEGNDEHLIGGSPLDIEYVSGQNTSILTIDAANADNVTYRCKAVYYTGTRPSAPGADAVEVETTLKRKYPAPLRGDVYSPMGRAVRPGMPSMTFTCRMFTNFMEITNPDKYFFIKWFIKTTAAGALPVEVGHGASITLPASRLMTTGGIQVLVYPEVRAHSPYQVLTDERGDYLTDNNGEILIGF